MTNIPTWQKLKTGLHRRARTAAMQARLTLQRRARGKTLWIDYGSIKLPFHGDGDRQELYYHLDGKEWWAKELSLLSPHIANGSVVIDVGANLGFMAGILSSLSGESGEVHSFEPSPSTYAKLSEVVRVNGFRNVRTYNMGCGEQESTMTLYCPHSSGCASLRPTTEVSREAHEQRVQIVRLDDFLGRNLQRLDFLKIDTEGFEDEVLSGASGILRQFKPVVYIELCSQYLASSERAMRILRDLGFTFREEVDLRRAFDGDNFLAFPPGSSLSRR